MKKNQFVCVYFMHGPLIRSQHLNQLNVYYHLCSVTKMLTMSTFGTIVFKTWCEYENVICMGSGEIGINIYMGEW